MAQTMGGQNWTNDLNQYLEGMSYPQNKQGLMRQLEQRNAPQQIRQIIQNLPERQFANMADVMRAMNEGQQGTGGSRTTR